MRMAKETKVALGIPSARAIILASSFSMKGSGFFRESRKASS